MADDSDSSLSPDSQGASKAKKRRLRGACDTCRKRKIKCDSAATPDKVCTHCRMFSIKCTHDVPKKKDTKKSYIRELQDRLRKMEILLQMSNPESTVNEQLLSDQAEEIQDLAHVALSEHHKQLSMSCADDRFFGPSSPFMFAKHAMNAKTEVSGDPDRPLVPSNKRPVFWDLEPWEMKLAATPERSFVYPPPDLLDSLVSTYFEKANPYMPVLHRPTFMNSLQSGQHLWDTGFGMTVLAACAVASRYSTDPRVLMDGDNSNLSCGWAYFSQVPVFRNYLFYQSTLYDLQYYTLATLYLQGTSIPHASWNLLGLGIRFALEKGIHRRKSRVAKHTMEEELAKRPFWCLICIDRWMSSFLGRPCVVQDEDFDVDYPVDCDDEYWETEDPDKAFKQPPGKPSKIAYFLANLKLAEIHAFALRMLYSTKKSKMLTGLFGMEWEHTIVAELDSSMNKWKDSLPSFLQWNPDIADTTLFHQSVCIHCAYFYVQIQIHRPFLTKKSNLSLPSLALCTNAARSCAHIVEVALTRGLRPFPIITLCTFSSAMVFLLNQWTNQGGVSNADTMREQDSYNTCLLVLRESEKRWHSAGRFVDMLLAMDTLKESYRNAAAKRRRDSDTVHLSAAVAQASSTSPELGVYGAFKVSPEPPLNQASTTATAPPDPSNLSSSIPSNDWDFNNILLAQMGYTHRTSQQYTDGNPFASPQFHRGHDPHLPAQQGSQIPSSATRYSANNMQPDPGVVLPNVPHHPAPNIPATTATGSSIPDEFFSMWSGLPTSLNTQDWDAFIQHTADNQ